METLNMGKLELFLKFQLHATHSLDEREEAHAHVWRIEVGLAGPLEQGRISSMPALRDALDPEVAKLRQTFLNENPVLDARARRYPTCECLAYHFADAFARTLKTAGFPVTLTQIQVSVDELSGEETGSVKLTLN
jgi:6-pyruvoyl-tetrahydropterin synthase